MNNKILKKIARLSWLYPIIILIIIFIFGLYKGYSDESNNILIKNSENALKNNPSQNKIQVENKNVEQNYSQNPKLEEESNIKETAKIKENGNYSSKEELAAYINEYKKLPPNYISKQEAIKAGWKQGEENLDAILPGMSIGGDEYGNFSDKLPKKDGRKYYEADVDYKGSSRNSKRIVYSNDGLIFIQKMLMKHLKGYINISETNKLVHIYKKADFYGLAKKYNISPILARIIVNRDIKEQDFYSYLKADLKDFYSRFKMKDLEEAVIFLAKSIKENKKILIVGDYDIDGVCASYILYKALSNLSAMVSYEIPDRIKDGYGINELIIEKAKEDKVDIILTCDNGIAAFEAIKKAKEYNIKTIITDHHDLRIENDEDILPLADFIINPKQKACSYPFKNICGATVAFKFIYSLYKYLNEDLEIFEELLEFVAIATVGDIMPLIDENRSVVKNGLQKINNTKNLGLKLLIEECNLENVKLNSYHIGFVIGPCLNAGGRLDSAKIALELFLAKEKALAIKKAKKLVELNQERKAMTLKGFEQAVEIVEEKYLDNKVLIIHLKDCHESLAGIIAGRIKERYNKPSIVFTDTKDDILKASARSIEAYNIFEHLLLAKDFLLKFGGHPMAAGLSLKKDKLDEFRKFMNENANLSQKDFISKTWIDLELPFKYISFELIEELLLLEPFGNANEKANFARRNLRILDFKLLGKNKNLIKLLLEDEEKIKMNAVLFDFNEDDINKLEKKPFINIIYIPQINEYQNQKNIQLLIKEFKIK